MTLTSLQQVATFPPFKAVTPVLSFSDIVIYVNMDRICLFILRLLVDLCIDHHLHVVVNEFTM